MALQEWHLTPEYINRRWTEELLALMFISRTRRYQRQLEAADDAAEGRGYRTRRRVVSEQELFQQVGYKPEEVIWQGKTKA